MATAPDLEHALKALLEANPGGLALSDFASLLKGIEPRAIQYRLQKLASNGTIRREGEKKGTRYFPPTVSPSSTPTPAPGVPPANPMRIDSLVPSFASAAEGAATIAFDPFSNEAKAVLESVSRPVTARKPVGYRREFLDAYRPNRTYYLPEEVRARLRGLGGGRADLPAGTYIRQILERFLIDLSFNSSRLEGNTYSLLDTRRLIEEGKAAEGKAAVETQMILNHKAAIEMLVEDAEGIGFNRYTLLNLHGILSENLLSDPDASGRLRRRMVGIDGSVFQPLVTPQLIEECFEQFLALASEIADPFEQAFFSLVHLPYLQPFEDVNKRVSRVAANIPFIRGNLCPLSFRDVPAEAYVRSLLAVYETNRIEPLREIFAWAYERSTQAFSALRQSMGEPDPFRIRYRMEIKDAVARIVRENIPETERGMVIDEIASHGVDPGERARFRSVVLAELASLHEGNIARYRLRMSEWIAWRK